MIKEFYVIHFWYGRKMIKLDFFVLRDAISQLHTIASSLLTVNSRERKFLSAKRRSASSANRKKFKILDE